MPKIGTKTASARLDHVPALRPRVCDDDVQILGVDPGGRHVGVALGHRKLYATEGLKEFGGSGEPPYAVQSPGWEVYDVCEMKPDDFADWIFPNLGHFDIITCEKSILRADKLKEQVGSEMETSQLIGYLRHTVRQWNRRPFAERPPERRADIVFESHTVHIHKGTMAVLRHEGIELVSPATPDHARSAELHLWHTLIRNSLVDGVTLA
jgi:hypothetical protein